MNSPASGSSSFPVWKTGVPRVRIVLPLLCLVLLSGPAPAQPRLCAAGSWDLDGTLGVRAEVAEAGRRAVLAWEGEGPPGSGPPRGLAFGVTLPWITAGTLASAGLVRLAADPLAFGPASDVFAEEPGLVLDGSASSPSRKGLLLAVVPRALGLFLREAAAGGCEAGVAVLAGPWAGLLVEGLLEAAQPPADPPDGWYGPSSPGGLAALAAARLSWEGPRARASLAWGGSGGTLAAPGCFALAEASAGEQDSRAAVLVGFTDARYSPLSGTPRDAAFKAAAEARLGRPTGAVEAGLTMNGQLPQFDPSQAPALRWSTSIAVERCLGQGPRPALLRLEASRRAQPPGPGSPADGLDCTALLSLPARRLRLEAGAAAGEEGMQVHAAARWRLSGARPRRRGEAREWALSALDLDARLEDPRGDGRLSCGGELRVDGPGLDLLISLALEARTGRAAGLPAGVSLRLGWEARSLFRPSRPPAGPRAAGECRDGPWPAPPPARSARARPRPWPRRGSR